MNDVIANGNLRDNAFREKNKVLWRHTLNYEKLLNNQRKFWDGNISFISHNGIDRKY